MEFAQGATHYSLLKLLHRSTEVKNQVHCFIRGAKFTGWHGLTSWKLWPISVYSDKLSPGVAGYNYQKIDAIAAAFCTCER